MALHFRADSTALGKHAVVLNGGTFTVVSTGATLLVGSERRKIGRSDGCALRIPNDLKISALHLEVQATDRGVRLLDLGTRNGTYIRGHRVVEVFLGTDEVIVIGDTELRFTPGVLETEFPTETRFGALVGTSPAMLEMFEQLRQYAATDMSVLIMGETGTGKELVARAIHDASRPGRPFVPVNCGALAEGLLESELFGHEKGAFTGAVASKPGLFVQADGGTLLLDELGEMSSGLQAKILRVIQEREVRPIGSTKTIKVNVRIVSATCRNLIEAVNAGTFREDLWYRIAPIVLEVPPLRKRLDDIPFLLLRILEIQGRHTMRVEAASTERLKRHHWPGNVRELVNVVQKALVTCGRDILVVDESFAKHSLQSPAKTLETLPFDEAKKEFKRIYYLQWYSLCRGVISEIARRAEKSRQVVRAELRGAGITDLEG